MRRLNATTFGGAAFLLFWLGLWAYAARNPMSGQGGPVSYDPMFFPLLLIWLGCLLSLIVLAMGLFKPPAPADADQSWRPAGAAILIIGAYLLLLKPLGFVIASIAMVALLALVLGYRRPLVLALVAVGTTAVVWVLFTQGLRAPLPTWPEGF